MDTDCTLEPLCVLMTLLHIKLQSGQYIQYEITMGQGHLLVCLSARQNITLPSNIFSNM